MLKALKNLLSLFIGQIPALGIAAAWWNEVLKDPMVTAVLVLLYEVGYGLWKLGKPIVQDVWKEAWEQQFKQQAVNAVVNGVNVVVDRLSVTLLNLLSDFRRRYQQYVILEHSVFNVRGLKTTGGNYLEVEQVFVELDIAPSNPDQASADPISFKELTGKQPIWKFLRRIKKKDAVALVILGPPGCGKSTLLQHLALIFAANRQWKHLLRASTPILLFLREQAPLIVDQSLSLADIARRHFCDQELTPPRQWFARQLRRGNCVVLLDGLDEVAESSRKPVIAWVERQIRTYPRCQFILTARPQGYRANPLVRAQVVEVLPFNSEQVNQFIHNWYLATKLIAYGKDHRKVRHEARAGARGLLEKLGQKQHLLDLTVNPLLLTMIANVHNHRNELPEKRVNLYAEICDVFLEKWQQAKGMTAFLDARQKRAVLQPLADAMMTRRVNEISITEAQKIITAPLGQVVGASDSTPSAFLETIQAGSGLVIEQEAGLWGFAHRTFQEYLCAAHWYETGEAEKRSIAQWQPFINDDWWHETLRLYAAQIDATSLAQACLRINTRPALELAANIAKEALKLQDREALAETISNAFTERSVIQLRRERPEPLIVSDEEAPEKFGISGVPGRPLEYIQNDYEAQGEVVIDHATGLMWQQSGSEERLTYKAAREYVDTRNRNKFAGYADWRLPTVPELMSLLEPEKQSNKLYINPIFDSNQSWCRSADLRQKKGEGSAESAWFVGFGIGSVDWYYLNLGTSCVRVVRSRQ